MLHKAESVEVNMTVCDRGDACVSEFCTNTYAVKGQGLVQILAYACVRESPAATFSSEEMETPQQE